MDEKTNVMRILEQKKIKHETHSYVGTGAVSGSEDVYKRQGLVRVSLGIYNTKKEANIFLETIEYLCRRYAK